MWKSWYPLLKFLATPLYMGVIKLQTSCKNIVIAAIYRHASSDPQLFIQELNDKLLELNSSNSNLFLLGEFNINISPINRSTDAQRHLDMLLSNANCPLITKSNRVTASLFTIIDHITTNNCYSYPIYSEIIE